MATMHTKLLQFWQRAASDLGLQLITPFCLALASGPKLDAILLIKKFGATKGMLIFGDYEKIISHVNEIIDAGYGFSVLDEPIVNEKYSKDECIKLLSDWGWSGDIKSKPVWL